ncbi:MAG: TonB-dependent receptor [Prevotella sp.]|nr:TonB-dependent receptor [Prevotella sp.]
MKRLFYTSTLALTALCVVSAHAEPSDNDSIRLAHLQEVTVKGVRATQNAPFAVANISKSQLSNFSKTGQELPFLFAQTPGILAWSENGLGTGTAYMRIRGAAGSRINVTLDGVALNSPEDQTVFWANMNSYAALLGSAQIQRGIGTSTNGDGAFGGSISLALATPSETPSLEITGSYGSYNTYNVGANFSTGLLWNHLIFDGAYHETGTDGYLHGTSGRSGSYYGGLTWLGRNFTLRYKNVGNFEKTGQAWNGVTAGNDDASLMDDGIRTYKDMYNHGLGRFNSLYESIVFDADNWVFPKDANGNYQTQRYTMDDGSYWNKTTDNFWQNHNILSGTWQPNAHWTHNAALHYTYGYGYYKEFRPNYKFARFGIVPVLSSQDTNAPWLSPAVKRANFVRRKGLKQNTYGVVYNANYTDDLWDIIGGVNLQQFRGNHFGYLDYISNVGQNDGTINFVKSWDGNKYYDSDADKNDYSAYIKATEHLTENWDAFVDLQYRHVDYKTSGINDKFYQLSNGTYANQRLDINKHYNFFNPKAGFSFHQGGHKAYASVSYASREPERNNFTDNGNNPAPKAEHLTDYELGYNYSGSNWHAGVNLYCMDYKDQFVQTGQLSDIGENLTVNISKSYRLGVELTADWSPLRWLTLMGNAALSQNKIKDFTEYVDDWDNPYPDDYNYVTQTSASQPDFKPTTVHYDNSTLAFSPSAILNGFVDVHYQGWQLVWHTNYVSRQYLDNTANNDRSLPSFSQSNVRLSYTLNPTKRLLGFKQMVIGLNLNNVFDAHYANSGWVYSAVSQSSGYTNDKRYYQIGFIPMAGFTAMTNVTLRF